MAYSSSDQHPVIPLPSWEDRQLEILRKFGVTSTAPSTASSSSSKTASSSFSNIQPSVVASSSHFNPKMSKKNQSREHLRVASEKVIRNHGSVAEILEASQEATARTSQTRERVLQMQADREQNGGCFAAFVVQVEQLATPRSVVVKVCSSAHRRALRAHDAATKVKGGATSTTNGAATKGGCLMLLEWMRVGRRRRPWDLPPSVRAFVVTRGPSLVSLILSRAVDKDGI